MSDQAVEQLRSCCADPPQYPQTSDSRWLWEDRGAAVLDNADGFFLVPGLSPEYRDALPVCRRRGTSSRSCHRYSSSSPECRRCLVRTQSLDLEYVELELSQVDDDDPPAQTAMSFGGCRCPRDSGLGEEGRALLGDIHAMLQRGSGPPASSTPVLHYPGFRAAEQEARDFAEEVAEDERAGAEFV